MKIKLNSGYQRNELVVACARNTTLRERVHIKETVAEIHDDLVGDVLHELEISRAHALAGMHDEITDEFFRRHASTRGRCNAIGSVKRAIAKAQP